MTTRIDDDARTTRGPLTEARDVPSSTTYERHSLDSPINLSDAHCRQSLSNSQIEILTRMPHLFEQAHSEPQLELEQGFLGAFFRLAGQPLLPRSRYFLSYSASCAITMVTSFCRNEQFKVALLEPVFDNIPSILRRERVELVPLTQEDIEEPGALERLDAHAVDVVWLVSPNNPTGWTLSEGSLGRVSAYCMDRSIALVLDSTFRFFSPEMQIWSQYDILESSGVSYVVLEDTGKSWSTNEMKVGITVCSPDLVPPFYRLHDDLLQSVSPFHLKLLTEYIEDTEVVGLDAILASVREGRAILRSHLEDVPVVFETAMQSPVSVDWIRLPPGASGTRVWQGAAARGLHVLPGTNFFWSDPTPGERRIRVALARDAAVVRRAAPILRDVLLDEVHRDA